MIILACILGSIFASIAALHAYWSCGGTWAVAAAIPQRPDGRAAFQPGRIGCVVVTLGLVTFAYISLAHVQLVPPLLLAGHTQQILFGMSGLFALRTIGEFNYFGLTRHICSTAFARLDRLVYTPLCAALSGLLAWLALGT